MQPKMLGKKQNKNKHFKNEYNKRKINGTGNRKYNKQDLKSKVASLKSTKIDKAVARLIKKITDNTNNNVINGKEK